MKLFNKHSIAAVGLILAISGTPSTAMAKGNVHLNLPGISINVGDHRGKSHRRHNKKYYNSNRRGHSSSYRDNRRDYNRKYRKSQRNSYYSRDHRQHDYRNSNRRYERRTYNNNYYSGSQRYYPQNRYDDRSRRIEVCPIVGFSLYIDNSRSCYEHNDHYHCE